VQIKSIGVVGVGTMGAGIMQVAAQTGLEVIGVERDDAGVESAQRRLEAGLATTVSRGKLTEAQAAEALGRTKITTDLRAVVATDLVIDAVFEDVDLKRNLLSEIDALVPEETLIASNTSTIPLVVLAGATNRPERVIGLHFFNPVPAMKQVEVIRTPVTLDEIVETARRFAVELGKEPVIVNDGPGFVGNLLIVPYLLDAIRAYERGVAAMESIDAVIKLGFNHPIGPFALCDLIGLDIVHDMAASMYEEYKEPRYHPPTLLKQYVRLGWLGRQDRQGVLHLRQLSRRSGAGRARVRYITPARRRSHDNPDKCREESAVKKAVKKTGDYGIGLMIHAVHVSDDVPTLNRFYEEVFGGLVFMGVDEPNWLEVEDRWAGLIMISDLCIETMAPNFPVNPAKPVGKFYTKFGRHLHSVGYKVDDLAGLGNHLIKQGVYIGAPGGGKIEEMDPETMYFFPSPRDMAGLMVELCRVDMPDDPRLLNTWSSQVKMWEYGHPLTIRRLAYITLGVKDLDTAVDTYVNKIQAVPVAKGTDEHTKTRYEIVQLGDCLLQLAQPLDPDTDLGRHVARYGNMIYGITFRVVDLDSAESWLNRKGIRTTRIRPTMLAADPADCYNAPYFFTTETIPNDPFES